MKATVKSAYFDRVLSREVAAGEAVDFSEERIDEVNAAFPGTLEKEQKPRKAPAKRAAAKKEA